MNTALEITPKNIGALEDTLKQTLDQLEQARRAGGVTAPAGRRNRSRKGRSTMSTQPATAPTQGSNLPRLEQLLAEAEAAGATEINGEESQIKFALTVRDAARAGVIDTTPNKHGDHIDDSVKLAEAYVRGRNKAVIFNHKEPKQKKLASTIRLMNRFGGCTKWDAEAISDEFLLVRAAIRRKDKRVKLNDGTMQDLPEGAARLNDAFNSLMRFARAQLRSDVPLTYDEYSQFLFKSQPDPQTVEEWLMSVQKAAMKKGEAAVVRICNTRLAELAKKSAA